LRLSIRSDITRPIFIDDDTTVQFTSAGKFIIDNVFVPAFAIAGSHNVTLTDWNIEYVGGLPVHWDVGGYEQNGQLTRKAGYAQPAVAFSDGTLTRWLTENRAITFDRSQGHVSSVWVGPTNTSAVFFITGDVGNLRVTGMKLYVPATAGGDRFIPMAFSLTQNFKARQTVTASTPITAQHMAIPHDLEFSNIELDGTYMGWQGNARNLTVKNVQSHRYGDLQDAAGTHVGGIGKWFAPPHLFYLSYAADGDSALFNRNLQISDVMDDGPRIGAARDQGGGGETASGYALSLKLGCVSCSVSNYQTTRPDGFLDLLTSTGLTINNATATYDSSFLNNLYPGWRFPSSAPSTNVVVQNVTLTDRATQTLQLPIGNAGQPSNRNILLRNVTVVVNRWMGRGSIAPTIQGVGNDVAVQYRFESDHARMVYAAKDALRLTLHAQPDVISGTQSARLTWTSSNATACNATGAWLGAFAATGSSVYKPSATGSLSFALGCHGAGTAAVAAALPLLVAR
jgi:hypothetical protein